MPRERNQERYRVELAFEVFKGLEQAENISKGVNSRGYIKGCGKSGAPRCTLMNSQGCLDGGPQLASNKKPTARLE